MRKGWRGDGPHFRGFVFTPKLNTAGKLGIALGRFHAPDKVLQVPQHLDRREKVERCPIDEVMTLFGDNLSYSIFGNVSFWI
jgi:hypothetical protein